jgi:hypothetical protein
MPKAAIAFDVEKYLVLAGIPRGPKSKSYVVDPVNGSDNNTGTSFMAPLASLAAAYALCVADQHDAVIFVSGDTGNALAAAITWSKDYTHLIGLSSDLPGVGQRCRVTGSATADLTVLVTFSGSGCIVRNIQFFNGGDADADAGAVVVSGSRNEFKNCFFAGMGHATPGARAGSYSLKVTGSENLFDRCAIGLDTITRAGANAELWITTGAVRDVFRACRFLSQSEEATKVLVKVDGSDIWWHEFEDCIFQNFSVNWAVALTDAFSVGTTATHYIILRGLNQLVGVTGWASTVTHVYSAAPVSNAGFGVAVNPTA